MSAAAIRGDWVGRVVDGRFPLLKWLGGSQEAGVFLTEFGDRLQKATIKLVPADSEDAEIRMAAWLAGANLSHPNLMQVYASGRCEVDYLAVLYVVSEFADEVLAEIIPERALTPQEAREMLGPALDALAYLHGKGFVHGRLKPSNIMAVGDRLKLSTDGLLLAGAIGKPLLERTVYDAPETVQGRIGTATDVWSLGATLVEVLTQHPPYWDGGANVEPVVPEAVPQPFAAVARQCLHIDPARRCTVEEIKTLLEPGTALRHPAENAGRTSPAKRRVAAKAGEARRAKGSVVALMAAVAILLAAIGIWSVLSHRAQPPSAATEEQNVPATTPAPVSAPATAPAPAPPRPKTAESPAPSGATLKGAVASQVQPDVAPSAMKTISGTIKVAVRLSVDENGNVTDATLESTGPSKYFANKALDAARRWKFKPAQADGRAVPSSWILHFQYRQSGVTVTPAETAP